MGIKLSEVVIMQDLFDDLKTIADTSIMQDLLDDLKTADDIPIMQDLLDDLKTIADVLTLLIEISIFGALLS